MSNKRPRIALLANYPEWLLDESMPQFQGHYAVWLTALSEAFARQDEFEIHWVTLSTHVKKAISIHSLGQQFHVLPRTKRTIGLYTAYWYDRKQIKRALKQIQPDLVHAWGTEDCYGLAAKNIRHCKKLFSIQGLLKSCMRLGEVSKFEEKQSFYEPATLRAFEQITAESPWAIAEGKKLAPHAQYHLFEYAVEPPFFKLEHTPSAQARCIYAGSDLSLKNVDQLVRVFSRPELAHIELLLAGVDGANRPNLPSNIKALGRVSRNKIAELLAQSWCLVHPSRADTGPTIAKEARVLGLPIILTENCGSKQHVQEGKSGYILQVDDDEAFVQAVLKVCASAQTAQKMGSYGQEHCREILSGQYMTKRLLSIYREILAL